MDLLSFIKSHSEAIPSNIIMKIASDIASGMSIMNSAGIVHRDLKSFFSFSFLFISFLSFFLFFFFFFENQIYISQNRSNVLLEDDKGKLNAVICDFGLAKVQESKVQFQKLHTLYLFIFFFFFFSLFFLPSILIFNQLI